MKKLTIIFMLLICFSCKKEKHLIVNDKNVSTEVLKDSLIRKKENSKQIDFNSKPITIKDLVLNDSLYWVTSSMIDSIYFKVDFCRYKNYHFERQYNIIHKKSETINLLRVYVDDDENKWSREKASEEFREVVLKDSSIKAWDKIFVGMGRDSLRQLIENTEYHEDIDVFKVYSRVFESSFYFFNEKLDSIKITRKCINRSAKWLFTQYLKPNNLDSIYVISNQVIPYSFKADFDGDKEDDIAVFVRNVINNKVGIIFFHSINEFYIIGFGNTNSALEDINYTEFSLDKSKLAYATVIDSLSGDVKGQNEIKLKNIALKMKQVEGTSGILTWDGEKYIYIHTGD